MSANNHQDTIPTVDLSPLDLPSDLATFDPIHMLRPDDPVVKTLAGEVVKAFTDIGFVYITNHGVSQKLIDKVNETTGDFFGLPTDIKAKYHRTDDDDDVCGWRGLYEEHLEKAKLPDYKETFNITVSRMTPQKWPGEVAGFKETVLNLCEVSTILGYIVLKLMGVGLQLENPNYFIENHNVWNVPNMSTLRAAMYPPIPKEIEKAPNMSRCGEHSDYGGITLVYQDNVKGLQMKNRNGQFVDATPVKGAVVVNIADMMQRWTADRLVSTRHRVVVPEEEFDRRQTRRSLIFFFVPDDDAIIRCVDNSDKYPPVKSSEYCSENLATEHVQTPT